MRAYRHGANLLCQDGWGEYDSDEAMGPPRGSDRVSRGGSWGNVAGDCQSSNRNRNHSTNRNNLGLSCGPSSACEVDASADGPDRLVLAAAANAPGCYFSWAVRVPRPSLPVQTFRLHPRGGVADRHSDRYARFLARYAACEHAPEQYMAILRAPAGIGPPHCAQRRLLFGPDTVNGITISCLVGHSYAAFRTVNGIVSSSITCEVLRDIVLSRRGLPVVDGSGGRADGGKQLEGHSRQSARLHLAVRRRPRSFKSHFSFQFARNGVLR